MTKPSRPSEYWASIGVNFSAGLGAAKKGKRRPDQLLPVRNSLGRRENEPESFVSSSCVGDQF